MKAQLNLQGYNLDEICKTMDIKNIQTGQLVQFGGAPVVQGKMICPGCKRYSDMELTDMRTKRKCEHCKERYNATEVVKVQHDLKIEKVKNYHKENGIPTVNLPRVPAECLNCGEKNITLAVAEDRLRLYECQTCMGRIKVELFPDYREKVTAFQKNCGKCGSDDWTILTDTKSQKSKRCNNCEATYFLNWSTRSELKNLLMADL
jgi:hypothetical protein